MLMGLMDQFVPFVEDGSKTHSMRAGNRWKVGMRVDLYAKSRQKGMRLIFRAVVMAVQKVTITTKGAEGRLCIVIDDVLLSDNEANAFAWRDGFRPMTDIGPLASLAAMAEFWRKTHDLRSGAWRGQIVHWDYEERFVKLTDYRSSAPTPLLSPAEWGERFEKMARFA